MAYSWRASALSYSAGSSVPITIPSSAQVGDWMMLIITGDGAASQPTGWALAASNISFNNGAGKYGMVAYKNVVSGDPGSVVTISTAATQSAIGLWVTQGPVAYWGLYALASSSSTTTSTTGLTDTTKSGDLILAFGDAFVTGSTYTFTSTNSTVTVDARDTTSSGASSAIAHLPASSTASTNLVGSYSPTTGSQGFLAWKYRVTDYTASAAAGGNASVSVPMIITGVTATETTTANAASSVAINAIPTITATSSAVVTVAVDEATITLADTALILICDDPAEVSGLAQTGYVYIGGTKVGDDFNNPIQVSGAGSQAVLIDFKGATIQAGEPDPTWDPPVAPPDPGTVLQATMWIRYTPLLNGTLTITGTTAGDDYEIEIFDGDTLDSLTRVDRTYFTASTGTAPSPLTYDATVTIPTYLRVWATATSWSTTPYTTTITLSFLEDTSQQGDLDLDLLTPEFSTSPGVIRVNVIGGTPGADLAFDLLGTTTAYANPPGIALGSNVATYSTDTSGNLYGATIPLPTVSAGTYTIRVRDTTAGTSVTGSIQVDADPITPPATLGPDTPIGTVSNGTTVKSWTFKDPAPGGLGAYTFPINPATMTTPHAPRNVVLEHTVAVDGHDVIWEAAYRANEWRFQGTVLTQSFYETLVDFAELNHRFWITDHRNRAWVASIESIDWTKRHALDNDWAWDYDVTALIFQGPVSLP